MTRPRDMPLNDGNTIPQLGLGVWQVPNEEVEDVVLRALGVGYRLIDTAQGYDNEQGVGAALREAEIPRDEIFVTTKLRNSEQGYDSTLRALDASLARLGLDRLDLFLIHWPIPAADRYVATWKAFVRLQREGRVRSIGVSNFLPDYIDRLIGETGVVPAVNQIELHPRYQQRGVRDYHKRHGIQIESYSPLGVGRVLSNPAIAEIAGRHGRTPAQVILRWHLQEGLVAIPKSVHPDRIAENFDVFDFNLDPEEMARIDACDDPENGKIGGHPETMNTLF